MRKLKSALLIAFALTLTFFSCNKPFKEKTYTIGIDPSFFPLKLMGQDKNVYGYTQELFTLIGKENHLNLAFLKVNWDETTASLKNGKIEALITALRPYVFYQKDFAFSDLFLATGPVLIERASDPLKTLSELSGKMIGVIKGSDAPFILEAYPGITIVGFETIPEMLDALMNEKVDGALLESLIANAYCRDLYQGKLKIAGKELSDDGLRLLALKEKKEELLPRIDETLLKFKKNGTLTELATKWQIDIACPECPKE